MTHTTPLLTKPSAPCTAQLYGPCAYSTKGVEAAQKPMEEIAKTISALCQSLNTDFENIRVYQTKGIYIKKEGGWEKLESSHFDISPQSRKLIQQVWAILEKAKVSNIAVDHQLIKQQHKNPSDYQLTPQNLKVTFSNEQNSSQYRLSAASILEREKEESIENWAYRVAKHLDPDGYDPANQKTKDTITGLINSAYAREDSKLTITHGSKTVSRLECPGGLGLVENGMMASFVRTSPHVCMLRKIIDESGRVDCISGRVGSFEMAKEMAEFIFLSQIQSNQLRPQQDGSYEVTFAVQSLLPMHNLGEGSKKMNLAEEAAYQELKKQHGLGKKPMMLKIPGQEREVKVYFNPLPIAISPFNYWDTLYKILPHKIFGKDLFGIKEAREQTHQCDNALLQIAKAKLAENSLSKDQQKQMEDTLYFLQNSKQLAQEEELIARAFLCRLLEIPLVTHCKSSVDRTNMMNAMIVSVNMMIRLSKPIPADKEGRVAIFKYAKDPLFKELMLANLLAGEKIARIARVNWGFKLGFGLFQHFAMQKLLPERLFVKRPFGIPYAIVLKKLGRTIQKKPMKNIPLAILGILFLLVTLSLTVVTSPIIDSARYISNRKEWEGFYLKRLFKLLIDWKVIDESKGPGTIKTNGYQLLHIDDLLH